MREPDVIIPIKADTSGFSSAIKDMQTQSAKFGTVFSSALKTAVLSGKSFEDTLRGVALRLSDMALNAALKPLQNSISSAFGQMLGSLSGATATTAPSVTPFAKGGVVASPTFFGTGGRVGVMGEAGAEAIMPLSRGGDGRLGVRLEEGSKQAPVIVNVTTPDVKGFTKSRAQVAAMLARTVGQGRRGL
ncbi:MAG: phage tail tape measure protein [Pseudomonadota bacterium]